MKTNQKVTRPANIDRNGFAKRPMITCPDCGKKVHQDAIEYHRKAEAH